MIRGRLQRRGAETAEAAVALPIVLLAIFAGFEYGWLCCVPCNWTTWPEWVPGTRRCPE